MEKSVAELKAQCVVFILSLILYAMKGFNKSIIKCPSKKK